ncbi:Contactin-associated protein-like 2 [Goodea atripinnis]|uniref:Contactin-associated protein-like 2 n=1 Tax=Goodea atripinnis TaxID=208336 RepID=A0ABV0MUM2_9TELE
MPYSGKPVGGGRKNFKGCMESINYNGDNITDLARRKKLDTSSFQRNLSFTCVETHTFPVFFNATSFLQLPGRANHNTVSVGFQFRTWNPDGLLLFSNLDDGTLEISLEEGKITVHINVTTGSKNYRVDLLSGGFSVLVTVTHRVLLAFYKFFFLSLYSIPIFIPSVLSIFTHQYDCRIRLSLKSY